MAKKKHISSVETNNIKAVNVTFDDIISTSVSNILPQNTTPIKLANPPKKKDKAKK